MTDRTNLHTFLGPVLKTKASYSFLALFSAGPTLLTLDYPIRRQAIEARRLLLQSKGTHKVGSMKLLLAIQNALMAAPKETKHVSDASPVDVHQDSA